MEREKQQPEEKTATRAGKRLHDANQIPHALRQEAQARWGVNVEISAARENGRYTGPVFTGGDYVAQRVGEKSVVMHRTEQLDFSSNENLQKRADTNRLNDTHLSIRYDAEKGKTFFHDPQRAAIDEMFSRIKKTAGEQIGKGKKLETFTKQLDQIKDAMVEKYREAKNRQFEQRTGQASQRSQEPQERKAPALER